MKISKQLLITFATIIPFLSYSQSWIPVSDEIADLGEKTETFGQKCKLYASTNYSDYKLFMTPVFVFKSEKINTISIQVVEPFDTTGKWEVHLTILNSPAIIINELVSSVRSELSEQENLKRFKNIKTANLVPLTINEIKIKQNLSQSKKIFSDLIKTNNLSSEFEVVALLNNRADAQRLKERILNGSLPLSFNIEYSLNARITNSKTIFQGEIIKLKDVDAVQRLVGDGKNSTFDPNTVSNKYVTRKQKTSFLGEMSKQVKTKLVTENTDDLAILNEQINKFFDYSVFSDRTIDTDYGTELARLSKYDIPEADLKPDEINEFIADVKKFLSSEIQNKLKSKYSGSVGVSIFSASFNAEMKKEDMAKLMQDNGWKIESKGKTYVVKGLDISVVNSQKLINSTSNEFEIVRALQKNISLTTDLSISRRIYPNSKENEGINNVLPVGTIIAFGGDTLEIPDGWLLCNGKNLPKKDYSKLFGTIKNNWGGDGIENFKLPDLRGQFLRGVDNGALVDPDDSSRSNENGIRAGVGSYQNDATRKPNETFKTGVESNDHTHSYQDAYFSEVKGNGGEGNLKGNAVPADDDNSRYYLNRNSEIQSKKHTHDIESGGDKETRPKNAAVNYIIKWK